MRWLPMACDRIQSHTVASVSDSEDEAEHLDDAPRYQANHREDGMSYCIEQHEEETKYHHSTFDFTIQLQASPEARFYLQNYKKNLKYATFRASFFFPRCIISLINFRFS